MRGRIYAIGGVELISSGAGAFGTAFRSRPAGTANLVREHEVLAVVGTVVAVQGASHPSPDELRRAVLDWALQKAGVQTKDNWHSGEEFEHIAGGRTLRVRRFCKDRAEAWALRAEHPDEVVPGRVWTTEVVIGVNGASPVELCLRLFVDAAQEPRDVEPAVPGCLRLLPGRLCVGPYHAESRPWYLSDKDDVRLLIDSLVDEERRLPIVALSETEETGRFGLDAIKLARALQGLAHVVAIPAPLTYVLTEEFGRRLSCYRGAARLFLPGFSPDSDPYAHRLILAERLASPNEASREQAWLRRECAALSLRRQRLRRDPLDFTTVRRLSLEQHADAMAFGADLAAQLASERERILGLSRDLEERIALEQEAIAENELLRERAEAAERDTRSAVARLQILLVARGTTAPQVHDA
jgi:hypothetical protein